MLVRGRVLGGGWWLHVPSVAVGFDRTERAGWVMEAVKIVLDEEDRG